MLLHGESHADLNVVMQTIEIVNPLSVQCLIRFSFVSLHEISMHILLFCIFTPTEKWEMATHEVE